MKQVYLLLGSNLGNREFYLNEAIRQLMKSVGQIQKISSVYETASWGVSGLPDYLNQVIILATQLSPEEILEITQSIEQNLLRERTNKWHSRTIDIDILFFDEMIIDLPDLKIPHPELQNRMFTLVPLAELIPDFTHPILKKTVKELKKQVADQLPVKLYSINN